MGIIPQAKARLDVLSDLAPLAGHFVSGMPEYAPELLTAGKLEEEQVRSLLQMFIWQLEEQRQWDKDTVFAVAKQLSTHLDVKIRDFLEPIFVAITGKTSSTSVVDAMAILGSDMSRARLRFALSHIGVSKKQAKSLDKAYRAYKASW
jgi:glutamyl-tRNA synthetase